MSLPPLIVVGESNPYGADPRYALYDEPANSAGGWLRRLVMRLRAVSYHRYTRRFNLCVSGWSQREAAVAAEWVVAREAREGTVIVLLGQKVAGAFGFEGVPPFTANLPGEGERAAHPSAVGYVLLPHPSGRNRAWNEPGSYLRARDLLRQVRPDVPWGEVDSPPPVVIVQCTNCGKPTVDNVCADCGFDQGGGFREEG